MINKILIKVFSTGVLTSFLGMFSGVMIARMLSVDSRGELTHLLLYLNLVSTVFSFSFGETLITQRRFDVPTAYNTWVVWLVFFTPIFIVVSLVFELSLLYFLYVIFCSTSGLLGYIFLREGKFDSYNICKVTVPLLNVLMLGYFYQTEGATVDNIVVIYIIPFFLFSLVFTYTLIKKRVPFSIDKSNFLSMVKSASVIFPASLLLVFYSQIDRYILTYVYDDYLVGVYIVAITIPYAISSIMPSVMSAVFSSLSVNMECKVEAKKLIFRGLVQILLLSVVAMFFCAFFARFYIPFFFGEKYAESIQLATFLSFSLMLNAPLNYILKLYRVLELSIISLYLCGFTIIFMILLCFVLFTFASDSLLVLPFSVFTSSAVSLAIAVMYLTGRCNEK